MNSPSRVMTQIDEFLAEQLDVDALPLHRGDETVQLAQILAIDPGGVSGLLVEDGRVCVVLRRPRREEHRKVPAAPQKPE